MLEHPDKILSWSDFKNSCIRVILYNYNLSIPIRQRVGIFFVHFLSYQFKQQKAAASAIILFE